MGWFKDFVRVANGLTLVAKEAVSGTQGGAELQSLLKKGILSATDLAGLTKGTPRRITRRIQKDDVNNISAEIDGNKIDVGKESIVFFKDETTPEPETEPQIQENEVQPVAIESEAVNVDGGLSVKAPISNEDQQNLGIPEMGNSTPPMQLPVLANRKRKPRERRVPSSPFSRALGFAGLGAGLAWGTLQESAKRLAFGTPNLQDSQSAYSPYLSEKNAERLALALCRMRGAALKLGQMLSIQDESLIPAPVLF